MPVSAMPVSAPAMEAKRLSALRCYDILDTPKEERFERITRLTQRLLDVPIALISFVDETRQWFKSRLGFEAEELPREAGFCAHAMMADDALVISDTHADPRFAHDPLASKAPKIRFYAGAPLHTAERQCIGALSVMDTAPRTLGATHLTTLKDLAALVMDELELRRLSSVDPLTGAYNRGMFLHLADRDHRRARRYGFPLSVLLLDVDRFEVINDQFGREAGNRVIECLAHQCQIALREHDIFGRWAGEEFAIVAPHTNLPLAEKLGERLRLTLAAHSISTLSGSLGFTVSFGVTECDMSDESLEAALTRANAALLEAKQQGRNRVISLARSNLE